MRVHLVAGVPWILRVRAGRRTRWVGHAGASDGACAVDPARSRRIHPRRDAS